MQNIGIEYVPVAALPHPGSKPLPGFNQSFGAQNLDRFAERGSTRAVQGHEIGFTWQNAAWLIDTAHNALAEPVNDPAMNALQVIASGAMAELAGSRTQLLRRAIAARLH